MSKEKTNSQEVILRALEPSDIDLLFRWENDRNLWALSNTAAPYSRYILEKYIESSHQDIYQAKQLRLMIDVQVENDQFQTVGAIDLFDFDPYHVRAGVGILIYADEHRKRGIATLALRELVKYAFDILHLHQLYCNITVDNKPSLKLFQSSGFKIIGVKKDWIKGINGFLDEAILQLISTE